MGIADSELYKDLKGLFRKYKDFAFKYASQVPYGPVKGWMSFADGKVEEALEEDRSVWQSLKDFYAITIVRCIASIMGYWYIALVFGALFGWIAMGGITLGLMIDPVLTLAVVLAIILIMLISPAVMLLLQGLVVHALAKIAGGKGSFIQTLSVIVLGAGAAFVLMVPMYIAYALIVGFFISPLSYAIYIFVLYLQYRGIRHVHKLSRERAAAVVIGSIAVALGIYMLFLVILNVIRLASVLGAR